MISQDQKGLIKSFNLSQTDEWLQQLAQNGTVILKNILSEHEVHEATNLFWQWLQSLGTGIKKNEPSTWDQQNWPGLKGLGFFATYGGCHSKASWYIRCNHKVREAFSKIWKTSQLISSFDTFIAWKPWWMNPKWKPSVQNLHMDQNPFLKRGLKCVQGMVPLKRVRESENGGLMLVPGSHKQTVQQQIRQRYPNLQYGSDWVELYDNDPYIVNKKGILAECNAGDLILWDSRVIHGGKICKPNQEFKQNNKNQLIRLSMTVTMVPRKWANESILNLRQKAFENKIGLTHWPHEYNKSGMGGFISGITTNEIKYDWPKYEGEIKSLV